MKAKLTKGETFIYRSDLRRRGSCALYPL